MAFVRGRWVRWQGVGAGDGRGDEGLVVVWSVGSARLVHVAGAFEDVVGPWSVSSLLEPAGDGPVVFEGIVEARPHPRFYQPVVDPLLGVVPLGPIPAQFSVSLLQVFLVEGRLPKAVYVGFDADVVEGTKGELPVEPIEVALT